MFEFSMPSFGFLKPKEGQPATSESATGQNPETNLVASKPQAAETAIQDQTTDSKTEASEQTSSIDWKNVSTKEFDKLAEPILNNVAQQAEQLAGLADGEVKVTVDGKDYLVQASTSEYKKYGKHVIVSDLVIHDTSPYGSSTYWALRRWPKKEMAMTAIGAVSQNTDRRGDEPAVTIHWSRPLDEVNKEDSRLFTAGEAFRKLPESTHNLAKIMEQAVKIKSNQSFDAATGTAGKTADQLEMMKVAQNLDKSGT